MPPKAQSLGGVCYKTALKNAVLSLQLNKNGGYNYLGIQICGKKRYEIDFAIHKRIG